MAQYVFRPQKRIYLLPFFFFMFLLAYLYVTRFLWSIDGLNFSDYAQELVLPVFVFIIPGFGTFLRAISRKILITDEYIFENNQGYSLKMVKKIIARQEGVISKDLTYRIGKQTTHIDLISDDGEKIGGIDLHDFSTEDKQQIVKIAFPHIPDSDIIVQRDLVDSAKT